ncbi:MAG: type II toxin-antitoxin system PemK/MazF family toxin [Chloroflexi bacterium]|nr:type II toxin-antitoxin system PemK/MazF family toxin [Chloroflexota bacterium]
MSAAGAAPGPPGRGEVWLIRLPRAVGAELQRDRPAVVVSSAAFDPAPVRIVVPLTRWRDEFADSINKVRIEASDRNGLHEDSAADFLQVRSVALERLIERLGELDAALVEEIVAGIVIGIDYRP